MCTGHGAEKITQKELINQEILTLENKTGTLSRNIGTELPLDVT